MKLAASNGSMKLMLAEASLLPTVICFRVEATNSNIRCVSASDNRHRHVHIQYDGL